MNKVIKISFALFLAFVSLNSGIAQQDSIYETPTYTLTAANLTNPSPNTLEWDVYLLHTNPSVTPYFYGAAQYFFNFNPDIANGGTLTYSKVTGATGSQLPPAYQPVNPSVSGNILRLASNLPGSVEDSVLISSTLPGTKVLRMRLRTSATAFANVPLGLQWRSVVPDPFTKLAAFTGEDNLTLIDISTPSTHFIDTTFTGTGPVTTSSIIPTEFSLSQNFPNPFNPTTKIEYSIPVEGKVSILIYDIAGREVMNLVNTNQTAGFYSVNFNGANLASGMYFYRINVEGGEEAKNFQATKRMVLIK